MSRRRARTDPAGLGRGPLTRWLPVFWQAEPDAPRPAGMRADDTATAPAFTVRIAVSAPRLTVPAAALAIAEQVGRALIPVLMGLAIDRALAANDAAELALWLLLLGVNFVLFSVAMRLSNQLTSRACQLVEHRLRSALSRRVVHSTARRTHQTDGAVLAGVTNDVTRLAKAVNLTVYPVGELAGLAFIAVVLLTMHWPLGLAVLVGGPVVVWSMGALSTPFARRARTHQDLLAATVGRASDLVSGYRVIRGIRAEDEAVRRYRHSSHAALDGARHYVTALGTYLAGSNTISGIFVTGVAGLAGLFAVSGELTIGELITAVGLAQSILPPLTALTANAGAVWAASVASGGRVLEFLVDAEDQDEESSPHTAEDQREQRIRPRPALELRLSGRNRLTLSPGEILGVRCDDRSAAYILAALLNPRALAADDGVDVFLDGVPAETLDDAEYRSRVVVAPHSATVFSGTVAENLTTPRTHSAQLAPVIRAAACEDFVDSSTEGLVIEVSENANQFSGGQRQRLALARALAAGAPILVLHEPTTAVDSVTEAAIASRLRHTRGEDSTLLVTTSATLLGVCDTVVTWDAVSVARSAVGVVSA